MTNTLPKYAANRFHVFRPPILGSRRAKDARPESPARTFPTWELVSEDVEPL